MPYPEINVGSGVAQYTLDTVETLITHELGRTIGFRHPDWFDRTISCGVGGGAEFSIDVVHIPGTPTGAAIGQSIMNACYRANQETGEFTSSDQTALQQMYHCDAICP
jgi:hypothetical protein